MYFKQELVLDEIFQLSGDKYYQDVTIICGNGTFHSNSFLLAAIFPIFRNVLKSYVHETQVISMPDMDKNELVKFFQNLNQKIGRFSQGIDVFELLNSLESPTYKQEDHDLDEKEVSESDLPSKIIKDEDYYADFTLLDPDLDSEEENNKSLPHNLIDSSKPKPLVLEIKKKDHKSCQENNLQYKCTTCERVFPNRRRLLDHQRSHQFYECPGCFQQCKLKNKVRHMRSCLSKKPKGRPKKPRKMDMNRVHKYLSGRPKSELNVGNFSDLVEFFNEDERSEKTQFQCKLCEFSSNLWKMNEHFNTTHASNPVSCHFCGKMYKNEKCLRDHMHMHKEGQTKCIKCRKYVLAEEISSHECETHTCEKCGKVYYNRAGLNSHIKTEHEFRERSHVCNECGKAFLGKNELKHHMKTHEEKKPCPECNTLVRNIDEHMRTIHTLDKDKSFQCTDCGKGFALKKCLDKHIMNVHLKLRPYKCRYGCEFAYNDSSNRNAHERKTHGKLFIIEKEEKEKAREALRMEQFV